MNKSLTIPNLGSTNSVEVVQILVQVGDFVRIDDPLCVVESEKSSFDIVSLYQGKITEISMTLGQKLNTGDQIGVVLETEGSAQDEMTLEKPLPKNIEKSMSPPTPMQSQDRSLTGELSVLYASPLVRKLARQNKTSLKVITGTGWQGRITLKDLQSYLQSQGSRDSLPDLQSLPDYAHWGQIEKVPVSKIKKVAAQRFQQSWTHIPHVTHFDVADITDLEQLRGLWNKNSTGGKITLLSFIVKALALTLKEHPEFNSSLSSCGKDLIMKKNIHIGCAVETEKGLMVPVIRDVPHLSFDQIKDQIKSLAQKARDFQLKPEDYQGQTFTVSSLGSHGGRFFTPIIQWPDVAILGICKSYTELFWKEGSVAERLMLPLSLSYDHRVIDGGQAARFMTTLIDHLDRMKNAERIS